MSSSNPCLTKTHGALAGLVTTTAREDDAAVERAIDLAAWFDVPYAPRRRRSIAAVASEEQADVVVVADRVPTLYHSQDTATPIFYHPGMGMARVRGLRRGERDRMVDAIDIRKGDRILDATLGLGADSLVAAAAVGPEGSVIGLEASWYLCRLLQWAKHHANEHFPLVKDLLHRIDILYADHWEYLRSAPENSFDIVMFDPMFRKPPKHLTNLDPARPLTVHRSLSESAFAEAKRVARRAVVVKERPGFGEFERLGLLPDKPRTRFAYGVWRKEGSHAGTTP